MKKLELIEFNLFRSPVSVEIAYYRNDEEMHLILNIPDLIDYLFKTDFITDWKMGDDMDETRVIFDSIQDPLGPEQEVEDYRNDLSLMVYMSTVFDDYTALKLVEWHEREHYEDMSISDIMKRMNELLAGFKIAS